MKELISKYKQQIKENSNKIEDLEQENRTLNGVIFDLEEEHKHQEFKKGLNEPYKENVEYVTDDWGNTRKIVHEMGQ